MNAGDRHAAKVANMSPALVVDSAWLRFFMVFRHKYWF